MTPHSFLKKLLEESAHTQLSPDDLNTVRTQGIEQFLFQKLTSKKFRKYALSPQCRERVTTALQLKTAKQVPLTIVYPQGGYKLWSLPSTPHVDWAEFFTIAYVLEYIAPVLAAYQPGVELIFYMHAMLPELHDNLTTEEITEYINSFEALLGKFRQFLPKNCTIKIVRDLDIYSRAEYLVAAREGVEAARIEYPSWPEEKKAAYRKMAELNIKWNGREDWANLSPQQREEKILLAALYEAGATTKLVKVSQTIKAPENILLFNTGMRDFIGIGTTKASIAKYWVGFGMLQAKGESYLPVILSPSQLKKVQEEGSAKAVGSSLLTLPNFDQIDILPE